MSTEEDFINSWLQWRDSWDKTAQARLIIAAAVDQRSDAESIQEYLAHLTAANRDVLGEEQEFSAKAH